MNGYGYFLISLLSLCLALPVYGADQPSTPEEQQRDEIQAAEPKEAAPSVSAEKPQEKALPHFEIELVLFTRDRASSGSSERWPENPGLLDWDRVLPSRSINNLPLSEAKLGAEINSLSKTKGRLSPLMHRVWRQPVNSRNRALPVYLKSDREVLPGVPRLEGLAKISVARYLHVDLDLLLRGSTGQRGNYPGDFRTYRFTQHRRMRSGELHYLDHPKMGVLIEIRKIEKQMKPEADVGEITGETGIETPPPSSTEATPGTLEVEVKPQ